MRIGIDIMGGDYAPKKTIHGAILALKETPKDVKIVLFGEKTEILNELKKHNCSPNNFEIIDCSQVITMEENPTKAFRSKADSSIAKGFIALSEGKIDGFASAGNTGAMFVGGFYSVKAIAGIIRPAISTLMPREDGGVTVLLDVGANADCKPDILYQFGILGSLFSEHICNVKKPKVGLLNLGKEKSKGNMLTQAAYSMMLNNPDYNFVGNIEGTDIFDSDIDVIVCDGFTGNIVLKEAEGIFKLMSKRGLLDEYFKRFNYENYGGTPILGLNKTVIIGHGISNEIAIKNMIILTKEIVETDLASKIKMNIT
ncbi:MAG: phosphate--acyl-ACP acyltransferase [Flavobacteriales bacterium]|nr:phosphate--acyl-ACP acyltransferase [Flavobacteriales bacterium]|tara:strand:+ start:16453 stop:17391 length:939 start_codon:yes stop_codon:yes gene_type:complete